MVSYEPRNWPSVLFRMHGSVLPRLFPRIVAVAAIGWLAVHLAHNHGFKLAAATHTMVGAALGLLLVFRTNTSYDRYWEGRKLLGSMVNRFRDLARQAAVYSDDPAFRAEFGRQLGVAFHLIRCQLQGIDPDARLNERDRSWIEGAKHRPMAYLTRISKSLRETQLAGNDTLWLMDNNFTAITDSLGGAERIVRTPVPFAYAQHIKGFLFVFCFTVPFVLVDAMGNSTPLAAAAIAYALFGIEEIGVEIEDPFGDDPNDLPMETIENTIATNTAEIVGLTS